MFDQLSAVFARCSEQARAVEQERDAALAAIAEMEALRSKRDAAIGDAERKATTAVDRADRDRGDAVQAADRDFFLAAQAADSKRQEAAIDADLRRDTAVEDAKSLFEATIRSIHNATAGLQAIADAEKRARDERDKAIRGAEQEFRDGIRKADSDRQSALDVAVSRQIAAYAAADDARTRAIRDAQLARDDAVGAADRAFQATLRALPAAKRILDETATRRDALERACDDQKRAIEARLRGDD